MWIYIWVICLWNEFEVKAQCVLVYQDVEVDVEVILNVFYKKWLLLNLFAIFIAWESECNQQSKKTL